MSAASPARRAAFEAVRRTFEHDAWTDRALRAAAERHGLEARDRALAQRLAYGAVQRCATADALIASLSRRPPAKLDAPVVAALRLGLYELLFTGGSPDHAAVDAAVTLAKGGMDRLGRRRAGAAAGLVNAVLRRAVRERELLLDELDDSTPENAAIAHSYPEWIARMWWAELGAEGARSLMRALNEPAEHALRVNTIRADPAELVAKLAAAGERVRRVEGISLLSPPEAVVIAGPFGSATLAAIDAGIAVPQSRGSQAVVAALDPRPGERVLDLCAGPGIKTTAVAARLGGRGEVVSVEVDSGRARQIAELCERTGAHGVRIEVADATGADLGAGYDRVLVDSPCTDLGALASRPDARWRKSPAHVERLAKLGERLLARAARAVAPGGTVVYSTCTVSARENEGVVARVLAADPELRATDHGAEQLGIACERDPRFLQLRPDRDGTTGFFIARLARA